MKTSIVSVVLFLSVSLSAFASDHSRALYAGIVECVLKSEKKSAETPIRFEMFSDTSARDTVVRGLLVGEIQLAPGTEKVRLAQPVFLTFEKEVGEKEEAGKVALNIHLQPDPKLSNFGTINGLETGTSSTVVFHGDTFSCKPTSLFGELMKYLKL